MKFVIFQSNQQTLSLINSNTDSSPNELKDGDSA